MPPHLQPSNGAHGGSPVRFGKHVRIEEVPDEDWLSGRSNNVSGSRNQHHDHPAGEGRRIYGQQPKQHKKHRSPEDHEREQQSQENTNTQADAESETHEQCDTPAVGATPQNAGVYLHTSSNPAMALGYTQSYSFLPNQVPTAATTLPQSTTYAGPHIMAYSRNTDYQNGAPYHPQGLHFQPPVPDTTYGPMTHIYVPRHDGVAPHLVPGGPAQVPLQHQVAVGPNPPLIVHHQAPAATIQPYVAAQPGVFVGSHTMPGTFPAQPNPVMFPSGPGMVPGVAGVPGSVTAHLPPDVTGIGKTIAEMQAYHQDIAMTNNVLQPEDFQPASKDPAKMYYCRELDGNWTLRSRYSIDHMGEWRWYQTPEGIFYAVRLPN